MLTQPTLASWRMVKFAVANTRKTPQPWGNIWSIRVHEVWHSMLWWLNDVSHGFERNCMDRTAEVFAWDREGPPYSRTGLTLQRELLLTDSENSTVFTVGLNDASSCSSRSQKNSSWVGSQYTVSAVLDVTLSHLAWQWIGEWSLYLHIVRRDYCVAWPCAFPADIASKHRSNRRLTRDALLKSYAMPLLLRDTLRFDMSTNKIVPLVDSVVGRSRLFFCPFWNEGLLEQPRRSRPLKNAERLIGRPETRPLPCQRAQSPLSTAFCVVLEIRAELQIWEQPVSFS